MEVKAFFDAPTFTLTFVVWDEETKDAVVIDSVLNYNPLSSQTSTESLDELSDYVRHNGLRVHYALETHAHADHLSGAQMLKKRFDAKTGIGENITAALQLGDMSYVSAEVDWLKTLLQSYETPPQQLIYFMETYAEAVNKNINGQGKPISEWFSAEVQKLKAV